jgi:hypothetical protein
MNQLSKRKCSKKNLTCCQISTILRETWERKRIPIFCPFYHNDMCERFDKGTYFECYEVKRNGTKN